ncbi:Ig-like domain-containing protein [Xenorhabdus cabanillasii]|nr:Ig-like domain-containing protein [Xenorhabdus cabanillasii]
MPSNDYTPNSVLITALDEKKEAVSGAQIHIVSNDNMRITPSSGVTNQDGQVVFCATSNADGIFSIQVASGNIKDKAELYFSPVNEAKVIITGREKIGEEYETITIQVYDKNTIKPIKNSIVSYKIDQAINISNILEIALNSDTIRSMITDEIGQFQINLKGKAGGNCIIRVTANNYVGSVKYSIG